MAEVTFTSLDDRLKEHREKLAKAVRKECERQRTIDWIRFLPWCRATEATISFCISSYQWALNDIDLNVSNVPVEDVVEGLLGPIHRKWQITWEMEIGGDEDDPTFTF